MFYALDRLLFKMYCVSLLALVVSHLCLLVTAQTSCNGNPALCGRSYANVSQIGTHDSAFVGDLPSDNQDVSVTQQLDAGIRFLQGQTHKNLLGTLSLCHTSCLLLNAGPLIEYLGTVKTWLDANPNEVLTILLTNGDNLNVTEFDTAFQSSGLVPSIYIPPSDAPLNLTTWPTLQEMITAQKRLVTFLDYGANLAFVPYLLDEFAYFFETPYDTTDPTFSECTLDRPSGASPDGRMYIVNHFLDVNEGGILLPDDPADDTTNAATGPGSIGAQVDLCEGLYQRAPKGILVDYFDKGDVFTAQNAANGL